MSCNFSSVPPPRFVLASFVSTVFSTCWVSTRPENKSKICQISTAMSKNDITKNKEKSRANVSFSKLRSMVGMNKFKKWDFIRFSRLASSWMDNFGNSASFSVHVRWCFPVALPPHEVEAPRVAATREIISCLKISLFAALYTYDIEFIPPVSLMARNPCKR